MLAVIRDNPSLLGAPTLLETTVVVDASAMTEARASLDRLLALESVRVVPFEASHAEIAREAYARYGKGRGHPAQLNFGDCMAYAIARRDDLPLLYKGDDFVRTDIRPALTAA